jgi:hypothetical protein
MNIRFRLLILLSGLMVNSIHAQTWMQIYESIQHADARSCVEQYDKGFLLGGFVFKDNPGYKRYGWILKIDINGNELWRKTIKDSLNKTGFYHIRSTNDNGIIGIGSTILNDLYEDPLVMKFNVCSEKEWCKIFNSPGNFDYGVDIEPIEGGGYMALINYWGYDKTKRIWLFRLDETGDLIWQQAYALDTLFLDEDSHRLCKASDTTFVITGYTYWPDSIPPTSYFLTPLLINVNISGESRWELPWGGQNKLVGSSFESIASKNGRILSAIRNYRSTQPPGASPCLIKTSQTGMPLGFKNLQDSTYLGIATTLDWFQDSTLAFGASWRTIGIDSIKMGIIKSDSLGVVLVKKELPYVSSSAINDACLSYGNNLFLISTIFNVSLWKFRVYAFKINANLDYDSIYTRPFTYDSLCPHPIVSDTIPLDDCAVVVNIDDPIKYPEKSKLHIYPNPSHNTITIELPQYLTRQSHGSGLTATTIYHQWNSATLEIFDLFGKLMYSKETSQKTGKVELDISSWHEGMYVARLIFMNQVTVMAKFIKTSE